MEEPQVDLIEVLSLSGIVGRLMDKLVDKRMLSRSEAEWVLTGEGIR